MVVPTVAALVVPTVAAVVAALVVVVVAALVVVVEGELGVPLSRLRTAGAKLFAMLAERPRALFPTKVRGTGTGTPVQAVGSES